MQGISRQHTSKGHSQCFCSCQTLPSISRPAKGAKDFTVVLEFDILRALAAFYLSEPELSPHSPIQYGFERVSIQMQCPLLLQGSSTHRRALLKSVFTSCPCPIIDIELIAHAQLQLKEEEHCS